MRLLKQKIAHKMEQNMKQDFSTKYEEQSSSFGIKLEHEVTIEPHIKLEPEETSFVSVPSKPVSEATSCPKYEDFPIQTKSRRRKKPSSHEDSKNIIKNYGKALCSFASSNAALPYIQNILSDKGYPEVNVEKFMGSMKSKKETTNSMESIRQLLIEDMMDSDEEKVFKRLFKDVSLIFMKFFVVNWIYAGRLVHKSAHLKYRFKMLRRIKDPENFTFLKD